MATAVTFICTIPYYLTLMRMLRFAAVQIIGCKKQQKPRPFFNVSIRCCPIHLCVCVCVLWCECVMCLHGIVQFYLFVVEKELSQRYKPTNDFLFRLFWFYLFYLFACSLLSIWFCCCCCCCLLLLLLLFPSFTASQIVENENRICILIKQCFSAFCNRSDGKIYCSFNKWNSSRGEEFVHVENECFYVS